jgi:hypothetical protein
VDEEEENGMVDDIVEDMIIPNNLNMQPPEEAHLVLGRVETFFFHVPGEQNLIGRFSKQGMELWEKYFARHFEPSYAQASSKIIQILAPSCLLLESNTENASSEFIAIEEQSTPKRKRRDSRLPLVESEVGEKEVEWKLVKRSRAADGAKKAPGPSSSAPVGAVVKANMKNGKGKSGGTEATDK